MMTVSRDEAIAYLRKNGVSSDSKISEILSGFDFSAGSGPYLNQLRMGDHYFQFVRGPSFALPDPVVGAWFCLKGAEMNQLAIHSPDAMRLLTVFKVVAEVIVLEGLAKDLPFRGQPKAHGVGGKGGATQIYVPRGLSSALENLGLAE
jgi:hypothetical protein